MKIQYLGTAAAERVPAIFCDCDVCRNARKKKNKEIRTQSQSVLDDGKLLIDFPGDSYLHLLENNLNYNEIENLLITHWHSDHFYAEDLVLRMQGYGQKISNKLNVYGSSVVKKFYDRAFEIEGRVDKSRIEFHTIKPYQKYFIGGYTVLPIAAQHGLFKADSLVFSIKDNNSKKAILYLHDTGILKEPDLQALKKDGTVFDLVSLDCTGQKMEASMGLSHMNFYDNLQLIKKLKSIQVVNNSTVFIANHFSHNGGLTYNQMDQLSKAHGVLTAYDGLSLEV